MAIQRITRTALDGSSVTIMFGRTEIPCVRISYGDSLSPEKLSFMGSQKIDVRTLGTYDTEDATIEIEATVYRSVLAPLLRKDGFGNEKFALTVVYGSPDIGYDSDLLEGARFIGGSTSPENSAKAVTIEVKVCFDQLYLTNERITRNKRNMTTAAPASRL